MSAAGTCPRASRIRRSSCVAAAELGREPADCLVVEDAPAGIAAARAGGMIALGIARLADETLLRAAGADLVVTSLDDVDADALATVARYIEASGMICSMRWSRPGIAAGCWWSKATTRCARAASNRASPSATASSAFAGLGRSAAALRGCPGCTLSDGRPGLAPMSRDCSTRPIPSRLSRRSYRRPIGFACGYC